MAMTKAERRHLERVTAERDELRVRLEHVMRLAIVDVQRIAAMKVALRSVDEAMAEMRAVMPDGNLDR